MSVMNTGICKKTVQGLATFLTLSACAEGTSFSLLEKAKDVTPEATPVVPLFKAQMATGAVTLVPPSGYCIEPSSLTQKFAAMARCDSLDAKNGALDAPIGLLTASVAKSKANGVTLDDIMNASNTTKVETMTVDGPEVVRATTENPPLGLPKTHLRSATKIDGHDLSLALFSPVESDAQGARGASMLQNMIKTSHDATIAQDVVVQTSPIETQPKKGLRATLAGFFK
jgi:hypothetical protein